MKGCVICGPWEDMEWEMRGIIKGYTMLFKLWVMEGYGGGYKRFEVRRNGRRERE
jgi:hypothetical protein